MSINSNFQKPLDLELKNENAASDLNQFKPA
jgi:hypothetical protein